MLAFDLGLARPNPGLTKDKNDLKIMRLVPINKDQDRDTTHSLKYGKSIKIMLWILTRTWSKVDLYGNHCSSGLSIHALAKQLTTISSQIYLPGHVPKRERQTLPLSYKLGLNRTLPPPVVLKCICGATAG